MSQFRWRVLITSVVAIGAVPMLASFGVLPVHWREHAYGEFGRHLVLIIVSLATGGVSLAIAWLAAHRDDARALSLTLAFSFAGLALTSEWIHSPWLASAMAVRRDWLDSIPVVIGMLLVAAGSASLLRFTAVFPRRLTEEDLVTYAAMRRGPDSMGWLDELGDRLLSGPRLDRIRKRFFRKAPVARQGILSASELKLVERLRVEATHPALWRHLFVFFAGSAMLCGIALIPGIPERVELVVEVLGLLLAVSVAMVAMFGAVMGVLYLMRASYALADPAERRRMSWLVESVLSVFWIFALLRISGLLCRLLGFSDAWIGIVEAPLYATAIIAGVCLAVFGHGALDTRLIVRKTALYSIFGTILVFVFASVESVVAGFLAESVGLPQAAGGWMAAGTLALVARPLHGHLRKRTDRLIEALVPPTALAAGPRLNATVVFADIVGYTRLTAEHESDALTVAAVFHRSVQRVANHNRGRVVKMLGDGALLDFRTTDDAIAGSVSLRSSFAAALALLDLPPALLRVGIHAGEVSRGLDGDIYGDTVNTASRLQSIAAPGEILLSAAAVARVEENSGFNFITLGPVQMKNLPAPIESFRLEEKLTV